MDGYFAEIEDHMEVFTELTSGGSLNGKNTTVS